MVDFILNNFFCFFLNNFILETPDCQQFITHRDNIGCKRIRFSTNTASSTSFQSILFLIVTLFVILI
jgi:hypothetical protein